MIETLTDRDIMDRITYVAEERFAWPGGYALGLMLADGECICSACVAEEIDLIREATRDEDDSGWRAVAAYYTDADDDLDDEDHTPTLCVHCNRPITDATTQQSPITERS